LKIVKSEIRKEFFQFILLILAAAFVLYYIPAPIKHILYLVLLPAVWYSKKDYFWLAFFFVVTDIPGGLFSGGTLIDEYGLPLYNLAKGVSFSITELFYTLIFIKVLKKYKRSDRPKNYFKGQLAAIIILFLVLILISFAMSVSYTNLKIIFKRILDLSLFYSLYRIINSEEKLFNFLGVLFPFVFIAVALQLYSLIAGQQLVALFKPDVSSVQGILDVKAALGGWLRPIELSHVLFVCFTGTLFLLSYQKHNFSKNYLLMVNVVSFLGILLTGTRSWVLAFILGYLVFFALTSRKAKEFFRFAIMIFILGVLLVSFSPTLEKQVFTSWDRLTTVKALAQGDITAGGTLQRLDTRAPRVIRGFESSSIILGAGFSDHYFDYADGHVGYHNILLNTGVLGSIVITILVLSLLIFPLRKTNNYRNSNSSFQKISIIPLLMLLVINTGTQTIGYDLGGNRILLLSSAFIMINHCITFFRNTPQLRQNN